MNKPEVGVGVILRDNDRVLLGKRKNSHGDQTWGFPGGHLDFGESPIECAARELLEETGLVASDFRVGPYTNDLFPSQGKHYVTLFVIATFQGGTPDLREPEKCFEWRWFPWNALPSPLFLPIQHLIEQGFNLSTNNE